MEEWKDIEGFFKGYYQVSNMGRVRSLDREVISNKHGGTRVLKGKIMKLSEAKGREVDGSKYLLVNLRREGKNKVYQVHRLVAEAFLENKDDLPIVNHKDGNKSNNNVNNLEWCTYSHNNKHALENNLRKPRGRNIIQLTLDNKIINEFISVSEAARITSINRGNISHCLNGRNDTAGGYLWRYK